MQIEDSNVCYFEVKFNPHERIIMLARRLADSIFLTLMTLVVFGVTLFFIFIVAYIFATTDDKPSNYFFGFVVLVVLIHELRTFWFPTLKRDWAMVRARW